MSRLLGKRARPALRGVRRSNAPHLPDWKPVWYVLEERGFQLLLAGAHHVKILPALCVNLR